MPAMALAVHAAPLDVCRPSIATMADGGSVAEPAHEGCCVLLVLRGEVAWHRFVAAAMAMAMAAAAAFIRVPRTPWAAWQQRAAASSSAGRSEPTTMPVTGSVAGVVRQWRAAAARQRQQLIGRRDRAIFGLSGEVLGLSPGGLRCAANAQRHRRFGHCGECFRGRGQRLDSPNGPCWRHEHGLASW